MNFDPKQVMRVANASLKGPLKRRKQGDCHRIFNDLIKPNGERLRAGYDPDTETGSWSFDESLNTHTIKVGLTVDFDALQINDSTRKSKAKQTKFIRAVIQHECDHAEFTHNPKDKGEVMRVNKEFASKYPFPILNLFEDIYIEFKHWERYKGRKHWSNFLDSKEEALKAIDYLYALKVAELQTKKASYKSYAPKWLGSAKIYVDPSYGFPKLYTGSVDTEKLIVFFLKQVCKLDNIAERAELAKKWCKLFGVDLPPMDGCNIGDGLGDPFRKTSGSPKNVRSCDNQKEATHKEWNEKAAYNGFREEYESGTIDVLKRAKRLASAFDPIKERAAISRTQLANSGNRVFLKNAITGAPNAFKRFEQVDGLRKVVVLVDQSGSMIRPWLRDGGREFITSLACVKELGIADVQIVYSCSGYRADLSHLPAREIAKTGPNDCGEGLRKTVEKYKNDLLNADVAIVFTDSDITDGNCNFTDLKGVTQLIGCCIVDDGQMAKFRDNMRKHFDSYALANSAEELARRVASMIFNA